MKLTDLKPDPGSRKRRRRVGRGISAGQGKTAGRGTKGQAARTGGVKAPYFEGGQLPLVRRLPFKRGFTNIFKIYYQVVNVGILNEAFSAGETVTPDTLVTKGLIKDTDKPIVILGEGDLTLKLAVSAHRFSGSAKEKIEKAGGSVAVIDLAVRGAFATVKKQRKPKPTQKS
ncbi:MAG: 50S ribosomal protein L15 [Anaerolineales bacterium]|nr:50S ribosomal protein L15 [Anaerolineales bacterium]